MEEEKDKNKKMQEHLKMLIDKFDIKIDEERCMPNKKKHIKKCETDNRIFFGYKGRNFFESDNAYKGMALEKATTVIKRITDIVEMKNQLNLLASLIHELMAPE